MPLLTRAAYARYRRTSAMSVTRAVQRGAIRLTKEGKVDTDTADRSWPLDVEPDLGVVAEDSKMSFDEATRRKVAAQALLAELELKTREGALLDAAAVRRAWGAVIRTARANLRNLPARLAAACVGKGLVEAEALALAAVDEALTVLADNPPEVE